MKPSFITPPDWFPMEFPYQQAAAWLSFVCFLAAAFGCFYALVIAWLARRLAPAAEITDGPYPPVTLLKPLHGAEPGLEDNLLSFCVQDYPGPVQIVFGVQDPADPAIAVVRRLVDRFPDLDIELVVDTRRHGANRKISNLVNMASHIRHRVIVLSDSDIRVGTDYLRHVVPALEEPGVGLATCLYRGGWTASPWSRLAAQTIDYHFLPSVLFGLEFGLARPCFGSTMALRCSTLDQIGGFEAFVDQLADDYAMGECVRELGLRVVMPPYLVTHMCSERSAPDLVGHEVRWARTIRLLDPAGFAGSAVTHALPFGLLGAAFGGFAPAGLVMIASALACRLILQMHIDDVLKVRDSRFWWGPMRDLLSFAIFAASFFGKAVTWRGKRYNVRADGTLVYMGEIGS
ncbi:MAG TPA: bacteriohopanetetrol glucosamine biosynthesis glycosyltransferase HpnI [Xanthobacteraceae bacterium]|nr:bacteriohopanetetrol glucosamine biosynthesis glycosyltransferase HpnI [Xanthobacteraceae bacterium]